MNHRLITLGAHHWDYPTSVVKRVGDHLDSTKTKYREKIQHHFNFDNYCLPQVMSGRFNLVISLICQLLILTRSLSQIMLDSTKPRIDY
jgi:hypothetical protein